MDEATDVVLIGAGVMSATLGTLLHALEPGLTIRIFERLDRTAAESSDAWNNAGTGHSGFCELNYTPPAPDGSVDVAKAIRIAEQYELSKQLWASLVESGELPDARAFVRTIPHMSFVWGEDDVAFLRRRHAALSASPLFEGMARSEDPGELAAWIPLMMEGRATRPVAATRMAIGNDVNFGALTRGLVERLARRDHVKLNLGHEVRDFERGDDGVWNIEVHDLEADTTWTEHARFVFIGAGGMSMPLLEATGIPEADGYGAFPVSGQWLRCTNRDVIERHAAKVYGQAQVGAPPMSVPHLDTRWVDGERELLFGPYAGFSTKFLKRGSYLDLFKSLAFDNLGPMLGAGIDNLDLTRYLVGQALMSSDERVAILRRFVPDASEADWEHKIAGQRVQIIAKDASGRGVLKFGTEVVTSADGTVAALLGASPGASTAVAIMVDLLSRCFADRFQSDAWQRRLRELLPSFGRSLHEDPALCREVRARSEALLELG
ncbi:MAG: malate dehydrogenase (quinone) [Sandaracinaceae bacterium]